MMPRSRILALDYGTKRVGVALSDELRWTGQPLETFERRSLGQDIAHIVSLIERHEVALVLLGLPLRLDGGEGPAVQAMQAFTTALEAGVPVPVVRWDERMTTKAAEDLLIAADVSRKKRKGAVDRIAAAILLQSYLASLEARQGRDGSDSVRTAEPPVEFNHEASDPPPHTDDPGGADRRRRLSGHQVG